MKSKKNIRVIAPGFRPKNEVLDRLHHVFLELTPFHFLWDIKMIEQHPMNSATEKRRADHLVQALQDDQIDIIWCLRGGYGSLQLLPYLDNIKKPLKKKVLIGLSDITSLHIYLHQKWGWSSLHGSHLDRWAEGKISAKMKKENLDLLLHLKPHIQFKKIKPINELAKKTKALSAPVVGGNLVTLTSHIGTPYQLNLKNKFLFIEEIGERAYRIDRCLTQIFLSGGFKGCQGLFLGQMTDCLEPNGKSILPWLWKSWGQKLNIPIFCGIETGHGVTQRPLPLGCLGKIKKIGDHFELTVENKL